MDPNDVETNNGDYTDYVTDLIPYRCPKCGNRHRFATLRELKHHIESNHAFKTARVRPTIFTADKDKEPKKGERLKEKNFVIKTEHLFPNRHTDISDLDNDNLESERITPLLQSYKEDANLLELELQISKQNEMRHKTESLKMLSESTVNRDFKSTLDTLSNNVVMSRKQQWDTADALHNTHDIMNGLEVAAENKCQEQRDIINELINGIKVKDHELKLASEEQNKLKNERERLCKESEELFRRADHHNESLKRELRQRNMAVESLNEELERIRTESSRDIQLKETLLKETAERMNHLKLERDQLIEETEVILKRADADSEELRAVLAFKEKKLNKVNAELSELRTEKHAMILKTIDFYKRTEESNDIMKSIIRAKDDQLEQALDQLEKMKLIQRKLVEESENLTDQADDNTTRMRAMLESKEKQVQETMRQLQQLKEEKRNLEKQTSSLNKRAESTVSVLDKLQDQVKNKEDELQATKGQLQELKYFLQSAAEKERTARGKLEKFIAELINRAERAESELLSLKSKSSTPTRKDDTVTDAHTNQAPMDSTDVSNKFRRMHSKIKPSKPVQKKYSPPKPVRRKHKHGNELAHEIVELGTDPWQNKIMQDQETKAVLNQSEVRKAGRDTTYEDHSFVGDSTCHTNENNNNKRLEVKRNIKTVQAEVHQADISDKRTQANITDEGFYNKDLPLHGFRAENNQGTIFSQPALRKSDEGYFRGKTMTRPVSETKPMAAVSRCQMPTVSSYATKLNGKYPMPNYARYHGDATYIDDNQRVGYVSQPNGYSRETNHNASNVTNDISYQGKSSPGRSRPPRDKAYYIPQPPRREQSEFRAPPYGQEFTYSLNSIPRVPVRMKNLRHWPDRESDPILFSALQANASLHHGTTHGYEVPDTVYIPRNCQTITNAQPEFQLDLQRSMGRTTALKTCDTSREAEIVKEVQNPNTINMSYRKAPLQMHSYHTSNDGHKNKSGLHTKGHERRKESEHVQYEELLEEDDEFPDELYLIPKSASEELRLELMSPGRETKTKISSPDDLQNGINVKHTKTGKLSPTHRKDTEDKSDANFNKIMDDNGILWDDMDTLPDVSDSELDELEDRLSPSGSEAIATKNPTNVPPTIMKMNATKSFSVRHRHGFELEKEVNDNLCNQTRANEPDIGHEPPLKVSLDTRDKSLFEKDSSCKNVDILQSSGQSLNLLIKPKTKESLENNVDRKGQRSSVAEKQTRSFYKHSGQDRSLNVNHSSAKHFRPINRTGSDKSSPSERDLTSGGKEVHDFMTKPPRVSYQGSADICMRKKDQQLIRNDVCETKGKISALFEEKLQEISDKYRLKRIPNKRSEESDRLKSISEKYRQRRKDILDSINATYNPDRQDSKSADCLERKTNIPLSLSTGLSNEPNSFSSEQNLTSENTSNITTKNENQNDLQEFRSKDDLSSEQFQKQANCNTDLKIATVSNEPEEDSERNLDSVNKTNGLGRNISDKVVSSFHIDNFKEIVQNKKTDCASSPHTDKLIGVDSFAIRKNEPSFHQSETVNLPETSNTEDIKTKEATILKNNVDIDVKQIDSAMAVRHTQCLENTDERSPEYAETEQLEMNGTEVQLINKHEAEDPHGASESSSGGFSIFAEPIDDNSSLGGDSNTQSMIDRSQLIDTDIDMDTDTESQCKGLITGRGDDSDSITKGVQLDYEDVYRLKSLRNTMSSASSQASLEFLDHVPFSRREVVRRRRQALSYIFTFLDTVTLCGVAEVCREWKIVSRNPKLWTRIELRNNRISGKFLSQLARRCTKLRYLILEDLKPRLQRQNETDDEFLASTRCSLESGLEQILKRSESTLLSLSIINCGHMLSSKSLWAASCYSRMLNHVSYLSNVDPINAEVVWALGSGCRDIKTFNVAPGYPCEKPGVFNTKCVQLISKCFRDLERLSIGGYDVDLSALTFIAKCCQRLEQIELNHMSLVTKAVVKEVTEAGLKTIRDLRFKGTPIDSNAVELFYETCKHLKSIEIELNAEDFFQGTKIPGDMKLFGEKTKQLKALSKKPGLGMILKLKIL